MTTEDRNMHRALVNVLAQDQDGAALALDEVVRVRGAAPVLLHVLPDDPAERIKVLAEVMPPPTPVDKDRLSLLDVARIKARLRLRRWWKGGGKEQVDQALDEAIERLLVGILNNYLRGHA